MTWTNQAESMMKLWTEAQRTMWQNWYDSLQAAATPNLFNSDAIEEWRKLVSQGMETWTSGIDPAFKAVSSQFLASQSAMMQMLQFTTQAWQTMAPKLDAGGDWQTILTNYIEQVRQQMLPDAKGLTQASQDTAQLWRMYLEQLQNVSRPWMGLAQQAPTFVSSAMSGNGAPELMQLTQMYWSAFDSTMGSLVRSPGFGFTREHEERISKGFEAWQKMQRSYANYQTLVASAWSGVFEQVLQELKERAEQDKPIESIRDLMRLWIGAADRSFDKVFRSDEYAHIQGEFVTDYMTYRIHEQAIVEETMMKYAYVPTRSEMDEAHRNIYELRKEVKALKKALRQQAEK